MQFNKQIQEIKCEDPGMLFGKLAGFSKAKFLFESKDVSNVYGRLSLIGIDPVLEISGKDGKFEIKRLNDRAERFLEEFASELEFCDEYKFEGDIVGFVQREEGDFEESERTKRRNIAQIVRLFLKKFYLEKREMIGLYGAFSYDFIRLFEEIPSLLPVSEVMDFRLFLYDTFIFFDHLKDRAEVILYREGKNSDLEKLMEYFEQDTAEFDFKVESAEFELSEQDYKGLVENAQDLARRGELFEVVYSNTLRANFQGDPYGLYLKYRAINPSPYLFFFDFGDEQLVGASPEMMVRCEHGIVNLRPISGTARRGKDPIEDHENMLELLSSEKERAELDMLIDLGRNDLARICEPGIKISDYRFVEKYSRVMHTVAHLSGELRPEFTAFDSLIACLNAGTLTGAPKVAAMVEIEKNEKTRRGYYGGTIGYLTFSGEMDTGIIIRTAHIRDGRLNFRVGATLLYDSDPVSEYQETLNKASAFLTTVDYEI